MTAPGATPKDAGPAGLPPPAGPARIPRDWREVAADNAVPLILTGIAFGGSFTHWVHLASTHGQRGLLAPAVAVCVDLGAYMAARERQRDLRLGRKRRGWVSWPTLVLAATIGLTLAGNLASAGRGPWGIITALIPGVFLLIAISLMERRAAEEGRRRTAEAAKRQRQSERQREEEEHQQRQAERQAERARKLGAIVNPASGNVNPGPGLRVLPDPGENGSTVSAKTIMRAYWDREVAAGRDPSGADLNRAAGVSPSSSLGRQYRAQWIAEAEGQEATS